MSPRYGSACPVARALDVIGEPWTILILRDLLLEGPRKFQDFQRSLQGISPNTLSSRLRRLLEHGIVTREFYGEHPPPGAVRADRQGAGPRPGAADAPGLGHGAHAPDKVTSAQAAVGMARLAKSVSTRSP